jgi:hypothetical protein
VVALGIDRQLEDEAGPRAADSFGSARPDLPDIPDDPAPLSAAADRPGNQSPAERFAEYKAKVEAELHREAVDRGCDRVGEIERTKITPAMLGIEAEDPDRRLAGFENRLKGKERLAEKVTNWMKAQPDLTPDNAFGLVKDAIRYTFQYTDDRYAEGVRVDCARLAAAGFQRGDRQNTWENDQYKGINSRWREPESGLLFEVQFHTRASFEAKQETHRAYERIRDTSTPAADVRQLRAYQREVCAKVPIPPGATEIPDYDDL